MKYESKFIYFDSRKSISKCRPENGGHFVSASYCVKWQMHRVKLQSTTWGKTLEQIHKPHNTPVKKWLKGRLVADVWTRLIGFNSHAGDQFSLYGIHLFINFNLFWINFGIIWDTYIISFPGIIGNGLPSMFRTNNGNEIKILKYFWRKEIFCAQAYVHLIRMW